MTENMHEAFFDEATGTMVVSEIGPEEFEGFTAGPLLPVGIQRALASWAEDIHPAGRRDRSLFARDKYVTPTRIMEQMAMSYDALDDDFVGNVADMSEALAFQKVAFECSDKDQEDVWSQIGRDLNLDGFIRTAWRELFAVSQFYAVRWWGTKTYQVRGRGEERKRRKKYNLIVPTALGFLDPTRVVPVQNDVFGNAQLAWIATESDLETLKDATLADPFIAALWSRKYTPTMKEAKTLQGENIPVDNLILLNPDNVFRHTLTKSPFERWARIRMKSVLPILDLKHQLREMDRSYLLGGINFLVLVTRGSDQIPAKANEINQTAAQIRTQSKMPIIVSDHRISVEIISPDLDAVLAGDKWATLDERISMRLWGTFQIPSQTSGRETSLTLARVIARGIESRRHMLKRTLEKEIIREVIDNAFNQDQDFQEEASIEFSPRRLELEMDAALINVLQELRDRGDLSRETILNELNFDQGLEARRRETEDEQYKDIFKPVNVPFDSPNRTTPGGSGRQGGRPPEGQSPEGGGE